MTGNAMLEIIAPGLRELGHDALRYAGVDPALLESVLSKARVITEEPKDPDLGLYSRFGGAVPAGDEVPTAACGLLGEGGNPGDGWWLQARPVRLHPDRDRLFLFATEGRDLSPAEVDARIRQFNTHFGAEGWHLEAPHAERWYLRCPRPLDVITRPLTDVMGRAVDAFLPQGPDARLLKALLAETEMLFHQTADTDLGGGREPAWNSLWLWGGGRLPGRLESDLTAVVARDPVVRGLARLSGVPLRDDPGPDFRGEMILVYLDGLPDDQPASGSASWPSRLQAHLKAGLDALKRRQLDELRISEGGSLTWSVTRRTQGRWWRRRRNLTDLLNHPVP